MRLMSYYARMSLFFGAILFVAVACRDDDSSKALSPSLEPFRRINAETDTSLGLITRISTSGCAIALYDHSIRQIAVLTSDSLHWVGRRGSGPGEISHAFAVAISADRVHAMFLSSR